ncbi:TPM domain-containing protein [Chryseolinea soli]|uniref:TPM domain-containing protein n=2 Tax=Chryseolinea soli TaxID=2321403 RepID=A0A385SJF4_9BACT|nr:TPM domain-containing protein [Chryseolinea soli]
MVHFHGVISGCRNLSSLFAFFLLFLLIDLPVSAQKAVPELWGLHVHDDADVLSQQTEDALEQQLKQYEDSTSNQIAILILSSLDGESIEEYSLKVAEKWKLGQKGKDNGVLLLVAIQDHKMRIETGRGVEGTLTDAVSARIIRNELAPNFRKDDFDTGIKEAVNAIVAAIGGEYTADGGEGNSEELGWVEKVVLGLFIFGILGVFTGLGIFIPDNMGWFLYLFLIPFYAIFPMAIYGLTAGLVILVCYLVGFPILRFTLPKSTWGKKAGGKIGKGGKGGGISGGGGWSSGSGSSSGSSSSSSWSSGSSGGGFSGGGGSFGGGGSSGSW